MYVRACVILSFLLTEIRATCVCVLVKIKVNTLDIPLTMHEAGVIMSTTHHVDTPVRYIGRVIFDICAFVCLFLCLYTTYAYPYNICNINIKIYAYVYMNLFQPTTCFTTILRDSQLTVMTIIFICGSPIW